MRLRLLAPATLVLFALTAAHATPVTYTLSGTFSGSIGALTFASDTGTLTFKGDTSGITSLGSGFYTDTDGISSLTLSGIGTALFLSPTFGAESQFNGAGFYDISNGFGVSLYDPALGAYALTSPFSDTGFLETSFAASSGATELTTLGSLSLTGDNGASTTFTASSPTPEPASFALLATGLASFAANRRRRARRTT